MCQLAKKAQAIHSKRECLKGRVNKSQDLAASSGSATIMTFFEVCRPLGGILGALGTLSGTIWGIRGPLGASWGPPGGLLATSWGLLGASWDLLGATWGPPWDHLRGLWSLSGALEALGRLFGRSWEPFGRPKGPKRYPKGTQNGPRRHQKSLSKRIPRSTALYLQFPINFQ